MSAIDFISIKPRDIVGIDSYQAGTSVARVTNVTDDRIDVWVINGLYEMSFNRQTGMTDDYGSQSRIAFAGPLTRTVMELVTDLEENLPKFGDHPDRSEYCSERYQPIMAFMQIQHDPSLKKVDEWMPAPGSNREGDVLVRQAKLTQLQSKMKALETEAAELGFRLC